MSSIDSLSSAHWRAVVSAAALLAVAQLMLCVCCTSLTAHNAAYHGLAGIRAGVNMAEFHKKRSPDEFYGQTGEK
jgi:hypothetical protein